VCKVPTGGVVTVRGDVVVAHHAGLNALTGSTFNVGGDVTVGNDAIAGLGCSPEVGCKGFTNDHIGGSLRATDAWAMLIQQETIAGNATIKGGGGSMNCALTVFGRRPLLLRHERHHRRRQRKGWGASTAAGLGCSGYTSAGT
jgi:hypothetical protein